MSLVPRWKRVVLSLAAPVAALVFSVLMSSIVLLIARSNPLAAFSDMFQHASRLETMIDILNRATPLYISGVAAAIGFRMNLFNIGVEGQYLLAAIIAAHLGAMVVLPPGLHVLFILLVAMAVGATYSGFAGVLKVTRGINEVISTIMLNAIAISGIVAYLIRRWQAGGFIEAGVQRVGTAPIPASGRIPDLNPVLEFFTRDIRQGKTLTGVLVVAILVGVAFHILLNRTRFGFDLRASGINPFAAQVGGVPPRRMVVLAMVLSGAVAGLVGMTEIMQLGLFPSNPIRLLGFTGIAVALLGRNNPTGILFGALVFAFLDVSSGVLQFTGAASREIVVIMQGVILLAAVVAYEITRRAREREEARTAAAALETESQLVESPA
ncbi:MAG TPA: ABC transporter permease [Acidimicrobiia bacterium]|nr:ABC transporter permease [Acidimicrobiia bacterium]